MRQHGTRLNKFKRSSGLQTYSGLFPWESGDGQNYLEKCGIGFLIGFIIFHNFMARDQTENK